MPTASEQLVLERLSEYEYSAVRCVTNQIQSGGSPLANSMVDALTRSPYLMAESSTRRRRKNRG